MFVILRHSEDYTLAPYRSMYNITLLYGYLKVEGKLQLLLLLTDSLYICSLAQRLINSLCLFSPPLRHFSMIYLSYLTDSCSHITHSTIKPTLNIGMR